MITMVAMIVVMVAIVIGAPLFAVELRHRKRSGVAVRDAAEDTRALADADLPPSVRMPWSP